MEGSVSRHAYDVPPQAVQWVVMKIRGLRGASAKSVLRTLGLKAVS